MNTTELHHCALAYLAEHQGAHLSRDERTVLIDRTIDRLIDKSEVSRGTAETITLQAYGELEATKCRAYIDMAMTTSYAVFIRDAATGRTRVFTVSDLIALCRTPALSSLPVPSAKAMLADGIASDTTRL